MKIIDLLNKIANGEEVPKKIKFKGIDRIYEYDRLYNWFDDNSSDNCKDIFYICELNDEVEIIEDKPFSERVKEIYNRHIDYIYNKEDKKIVKLKKDNFGNNKDLDEVDSDIYFIVDKINELIDYINNGD